MEYEDVLKELFTQLFAKVGEEIRDHRKNPCAEYLKKTVFPKGVSKRTYVRYYDRFIANEYTEGGNPSTEQLHQFAQYLEYKSFASFEEQLVSGATLEKESEPEAEIIKASPKKLDDKTEERLNYINKKEEPKIVLSDEALKKKAKKINDSKNRFSKKGVLILFFLLLGIFAIYYFWESDKNEKTTCVFWVEDHYEKMECSEDGKMDNGEVLNSENDWVNFKNKRQVIFESNDPFENENGAPILWYDLSADGYQFFNFSGQHPTNGKQLKPVDQNFVNLYFSTDQISPDIPTNNDVDFTEQKAFDTIDKSLELKPIDETELTPMCELNNTGTICFKNLGETSIRIRFLPKGTDRKSTLELTLKKYEKKCFFDYLAGIYTYQVYRVLRNEFAEQGAFTITECETENVNFKISPVTQDSEVEEDKPTETVKPKECEIKGLGDFCFTNTGDQAIHIVISDYSPTSPLSQRYLKLDLEAGENGCYYDVPIGAYNVEYYDDGRNRTHSKYAKIKIEQCEEGQKSIQF